MDEEETFVHTASDIRYWLKQKVYYFYVSDKEHDYRVLYYTFIDSYLTLIQYGFPGKKNNVVLMIKNGTKVLFLMKTLKNTTHTWRRFLR